MMKDFPGGSGGQDSMLPKWVRSLAGELKSHMPQDTAKQKEGVGGGEMCDERYHKEKPAEGQICYL